MTSSAKTRVIYLGLGSNIDPEINLPTAVDCLREHLDVVAVSSAWQTPAVGSSGPDYINSVVAIRSNLPPDAIKQDIINYIESELGRVRTRDKYADRTIDIDILAVDNEPYDEEIWHQAHVAVPLAELNPDIVNEKTGKRLENIANSLGEKARIKERPEIKL